MRVEDFKDIIRDSIDNAKNLEERLYWEGLRDIASVINIEAAYSKFQSDFNKIFSNPNFSWETTNINDCYKDRILREQEEDDNSEELWNRR